jgi:hypothetical protein
MLKQAARIPIESRYLSGTSGGPLTRVVLGSTPSRLTVSPLIWWYIKVWLKNRRPSAVLDARETIFR